MATGTLLGLQRTTIRSASPLVSLLLLCAVTAAGPALALDPQRAVTQYDIKTWFAKDGLPQNSVHSILQTPDGYLWLATEEGLARFDGAQFTTFGPNNHALGHRYVLSLSPSPDGGFWIVTMNGGVTRYRDGSFTPRVIDRSGRPIASRSVLDAGGGVLWIGSIGGGLTRLQGDRATAYTRRDGLSSDNVFKVASDGEGGLWLGTPEGLDRFRDGKIEMFTTREGLAGNAVLSLLRDRSGVLWIGTINGLTRYENGRFTSYRAADGLPNEAVYALLEDRSGNLWIGTEGGLCRRSGESFSSLTERDGLSGNRVRSLYEDREGSLWVGSFGGGLTRLQNGKFVTFTTREGLAHDSVGPLLQDREGAIWIGTMGAGVTRWKDGRAVTFTTKDGLPSNLVDSLLQDRDGAMWIGTAGYGIARYRDGVFKTYSQREGLAGNTIHSLAQGPDGSLWIATAARGVDRLKDGVITHFTTAQGLANNSVRSLTVDPDGVLWLSTLGGLSRFQNGRFTNYTARNGLPFELLGPAYRDSRGVLWIGTVGGGLIRFKEGAFKLITTGDGLFDDTTYAIVEDAKGFFWMSCNHGVFRVARRQLDDFADGKIAKVESLAFGEADGMRNRECNGNSPGAFLARDGRIWFSTLHGAATIDPLNIAFNSAPPPVLIEQVLADGREVSLPAASSSSSPPAIEAALPGNGAAPAPLRSGAAPPGKGALELHFAAASFQAAERVRFRYRLEGFDKEWIEAGTRRVAYYTNLPPGAYTFRVVACNNDGVWNEAGASVALRLAPHFYQTWWFDGLVAAALIVLVGWWHRSRVRRLKLRARALSNLVDERTRAQEALAVSNARLAEALLSLQRAQDSMVQQERLRALGQMASGVTHDFNNALTPILGYTDLLITHPQILEDRGRALGHLSTIHTAAQDAAHVVQRLREFYRPRDAAECFPLVTLHGIVEQVVSLTQPRWKDQAMGRGVAIEVRAELEETPCFPGNDSDLREMLTNLIFNAVDAMPQGGVITVRTREEDGHVVLEVADTGTGMTDEVRRRCLEPFFTTKGDEGTGLGLPMVYGIVQRHHGTIDIHSAPGKGTMFIARFPIEPASDDAQSEEASARAAQVQAKRVLVVEDDARILGMIQECLMADGHLVTLATNGRDGLIKVRHARFDLIITDRSMPLMNGEQLAVAAKRLSPSTPILLLTGFGDHMIDRGERPDGVDLVLGKPITVSALRDAIGSLTAAGKTELIV